jgi:hypothetical protein
LVAYAQPQEQANGSAFWQQSASGWCNRVPPGWLFSDCCGFGENYPDRIQKVVNGRARNHRRQFVLSQENEVKRQDTTLRY